MTDIKDRLTALLYDEPTAPDDVDAIVSRGRRALRRRTTITAAAGTAGAAALTAAVVVPITATAGHGNRSESVSVASSGTPGRHCRTITTHEAKRLHLGGVVTHGKQYYIHRGPAHAKAFAVCGRAAAALKANPGPTTPPADAYHYTEAPQQIAIRLGEHLTKRVEGLGFTITYTRPFAQESSSLESGHPSYYDGNVDVREADGYADIGVQVTHKVTTQVKFTGACNADGPAKCVETTLPDGSVLRTGEVHAGAGSLILTAEVHRPDGTVVQAQESNYAFGPDAATEPHGSQPLTLDQLTALAEDAQFSF
ncbi:MAG TPA: hypothetical protein VG708_14345 [Mycobacteriales bacterium]|nr:hypothetical protein [Mycobacteriales bacterium]